MRPPYEQIAKYLSGEMKALEKSTFETWIVENERDFSEMKVIWEQSGQFASSTYDVEVAWKKVKNGTSKESEKAGARMRLFTWASAASVIILIGLFFFVPNASEGIVMPIVTMAAIDGSREVKLLDGSIITLKQGSEITYPEEFTADKRMVSLEGTAFFDIAKDADRPFYIDAPLGTVKVLGTSFDVISDTLTMVVSVHTGSVSLTSRNTDESVILEPGFSGEIENAVVSKYSTSVSNTNSWRSGYFDFDGASLDKVISDLNGYYRKEIIIEENVFPDCELTARFDKLPLEDVLVIIQLTCNVLFEDLETHYLLLGDE